MALAGSGPAAVGLGRALAGAGHRVTLVSPLGVEPSNNTLCAFADQLPPSMQAVVYPRTVVATDAGATDIGRPYARFDTAQQMADLMRQPGVVGVADRVVGSDNAGVITSSGAIAADVVVDATGHMPVLVRRQRARPAWQSAWGMLVRGRDTALPPGTALFMDWRASGVDDGGPPSFLYALSNTDGTMLLEETTLASAAWVPTEILKARLEARLRRRGTVIDTIIDTEVVRFAMSGGLPLAGQRVAAFGAALGLVSPLSGYSVARSLALAPAVANAISGSVGDAVGDAVVDTVWTPSARNLRRLQQFGLAAACRFDQRTAGAFFESFFALPTGQWRGMLDGTDDVDAARRTMLALFATASPAVRWRLMAGALSTDGVAIVADAVIRSVPRAAPSSVRSTP